MRDSRVVLVLIEGEILRKDDTFWKVTDGEVSVYADGTLDLSRGDAEEILTPDIGAEIYDYQ